MPRVANNAVTVTTAAALLVDGNPNRTYLSVTNGGSVTVYLGSSVVSSTAFVVAVEAGDSVVFTNDGVDKSACAKWYAVTASSSVSVSVGEISA